MSEELDHLRVELKRLLANLEQAQSDRDEALARLEASRLEVRALRQCLDKWICEEAARLHRPRQLDESASSPAQ
jgi:hypothetical protein